MAKKAVKEEPSPKIPGSVKLAIELAVLGVALAIIIIAFTQPGSKTPPPPATVQGCDSASGYVWCAEKGKCLRLWEENCTIAGLGSMEKDSHGCIPTAGYVWCESKGKCLRLWEEECQMPQALGSSGDVHGCIPSAGYVWCEENSRCIRQWAENCSPSNSQIAPIHPSANDAVPRYSFDQNGCVPSAGYVWCEEKRKCLRLWEESCGGSEVVGGDTDSHGCIPTAGYVWCEGLQACVQPWETPCNTTVQENATVDENGCDTTQGYTWCAEKNKCLRLWEENCTMQAANLTDLHGCLLSQGYVWCEEKQKCLQLVVENCTSGAGDDPNAYCNGLARVYLCGSYIKVVSHIPGNGSVFYKSGFPPLQCEGMPSPDFVTPLCRILMDSCSEVRVC